MDLTLVVRELEPECAHQWQARDVCLPEQGVDVGQERVPSSDGVTDAGRGGLSKQPWLTTRSLQVGMSTEEGVEGSHLVPADDVQGGVLSQ